MKEIRTALLVIVVFSLLLGVAYPLLVTGIGQLAFSSRANGSLVSVDGSVVGSELIGQSFVSAGYFHGRPSPSDYNAMASGASNLGPTNAAFLLEVRTRVDRLLHENDLALGTLVPADLVLASASGLDPDISLEGALLQVRRVAAARGLDVAAVRALVQQMTRGPFLGAFGESRVNVLRLNLALDELS
jgi:potassium-transporting ATPase KdpC subunit